MPAAAPATPATPSMPTLRRKVEEKRATKAMLQQMGERTDTIDAEIAKLLSIISREERATPTVADGAADGSQGGEPADPPSAAAGTPPPRPVFRFGAGTTPAPAPVLVPARAPPSPFSRARVREPSGLSTALGHLTRMGFVESEARAALLATNSRAIGQREIEQATHMLLSGAVPDADVPQAPPVYDHSPFRGYDRSPFGGSYRSRDEDQWMDPGAEDGFDPSDAAATTERIEQLMNLVAPNDRYRTDEYQTCYRILMEKESVQWSVPRAADWLFSRAGGEDSPIGPVLDTLPVMFRVRLPDPLDIAAGQELVRAGSGSGRNDIVWEWERRGGATFGQMRANPDIYDENGRPDPDRWGEYPVEAMAMLDVEWAKGEGARGAVLVRSGGSEYLVDLNQMTQTDVDPAGTGIGMGLSPARRRIRRRRARAAIGPLGIGETLSVMEDPSLSGDTIIAPQSYIERLDTFKIGRRNRAAVFRLSLLKTGGADGMGDADTEAPRFIYCRALEFSGMEGTCAVPTWMARALQIPAFGSGASARVLVQPWLLPTCGGVKLKCITPGFEELVRAGAAEAADGSFDVTSVLSGPLSRDFCTLTSGSIVPMRCGEGGDVFEFIVTRLRRLQHPEAEEQEVATGVAEDLDVDGVDLKSTFNAELALDMTYLTDDVQEIRKVAPNLDDAAAREILQKAGFDLLAALKAAEAAGAAKALSDRKHQAREVKRLEQLAGVSRDEAERALAANGWSLAAAQAALAAGGGAAGDDDDDGAELTRGPSNNTLRNRRLERLSGGAPTGAEYVFARSELSRPEVPLVERPGGQGETTRNGDDCGVALAADDSSLSRMPSANTTRQRRLAALAARGVA